MASSRYFYEPWRAGEAHPEADTSDLGYWSPPFCLEKEKDDPHEMIAYSIPLRHDGRVYGVLGVEISCQSLFDYFPVAELNASQQSGYLWAPGPSRRNRVVQLVSSGMLQVRDSSLLPRSRSRSV